MVFLVFFFKKSGFEKWGAPWGFGSGCLACAERKSCGLEELDSEFYSCDPAGVCFEDTLAALDAKEWLLWVLQLVGDLGEKAIYGGLLKALQLLITSITLAQQVAFVTMLGV